MSERYYPMILAAISEYRVHIGIVWNTVEYVAFYSSFVRSDATFVEIKTLEALYLEKMARVVLGSFGPPKSA